MFTCLELLIADAEAPPPARRPPYNPDHDGAVATCLVPRLWSVSGRPIPSFQSMRATLRAPRAVVVFNGGERWRSHAAHALYEAGRIWGGSGFLLVPHHEGEVNPSLRRMVIEYDPDYVVAIGMPVDSASPSEPDGPEGSPPRRVGTSFRRPDPLGLQARKTLAGDCSPHHISLRRDGSVGGGEPRRHQTREPVQYLSTTRTSGPFISVDQLRGKDDFDPAGVQSPVRGSWALAAAIRVGFRHPPEQPFEHQPDPAEPTYEEATIQELAAAAFQYQTPGLPTSFMRHPSWSSAWRASEKGLVTIQSWETGRKPHLVVFGDSADDFALALGWDRMFGRARWIPESTIPNGPLRADMALLAHDLADDSLGEDTLAHITSTSLNSDQLAIVEHWFRAQADSLISAPIVDVDDAGNLIESSAPAVEEGSAGESDSVRQISLIGALAIDWEHPRKLALDNQYDLPLALPAELDEHGNLSILVDMPPLLPDASVMSTVDQAMPWQLDLFIPHPTPRARGLDSSVVQEPRAWPELVRASKAGLTTFSRSYGFVMGGSTAVQQLSKPRLRLPGLLEWVRAMIEDDQLTAGFSGAGHRVEILRRTWGSREALTKDWAGRLRPMFLAFGRAGKSTSQVYPNGEGIFLANLGGLLSFEGIAHVLGTHLIGSECEPPELELRALRADVDALTARGVLTRGMVLNCEACADVAFVSLDRVGAENTCSRCGATNALGAPRWQAPRSRFIPEPPLVYDLHPAARELLREDTGVALLLSQHLQTDARSYTDLAETEFYSDGKAVAEIDLIACVNDKVIVAEAKRTPSLGTKAQRQDKAAKLARIARALRADAVVLCTSSTSPWKGVEIDAVRTELARTFEGRARTPTLRTVTGLGSAVTDDVVASV